MFNFFGWKKVKLELGQNILYKGKEYRVMSVSNPNSSTKQIYMVHNGKEWENIKQEKIKRLIKSKKIVILEKQ